MAKNNVTISVTGQYTDRDIKRAMRDLQSLQKQGPKTSKGLSHLKIGLAAAGAAAAAFAVKLGVDAVQAAMKENAEVAKLNKTLSNLGFGAASDQVNKFIDDLQWATTFSDSETRPAMEKLAVATGSVTKAQAALRTALDLATFSGVSAEAAAAALAKAFGGNTKSLKTMVPGFDAVILKSGDMNRIMEELSRIVGGQAAAAAETMSGRLEILTNGIGELQEAFGQGILQGFMDSLTQGSDDLQTMTDSLRTSQAQFEAFGKIVGGILAGLYSAFRSFGEKSLRLVLAFDGLWDLQARAAINLRDALGLITDAEGDQQRAALDAAAAAREQTIKNYQLATSGEAAADGMDTATGAAVNYGNGLNEVADQAELAKAGLSRLQKQMDRMAKNRSIASQLIGLARERSDGPDKSGERTVIGPDGKKKKVKFSTATDIRDFGLQYMDDAQAVAMDIAERGNFSRKSRRRGRNIIEDARDFLSRFGLGAAFTTETGKFGGTPNELRSYKGWTAPKILRSEDNMWGPTTQTTSSGTTVNIQTMNVNVPTVAEAIEQARKAARLQGLGRGQTASAMRYSGMAAAS